MKSDGRSIAGMITLLALTLSMAEGVWAAVCSLDMTMGPMAAVVGMAPSDDGTAALPAESDPQESNMPDCPLNLAGTVVSCVVAASIPAHAPVDLTPSPEGSTVLPSSEARPMTLLGSRFFHPPRP